MRCLALAQAWQVRGGAVTFACHHTLPQNIEARLLADHMQVQFVDAEPGSRSDAMQTIDLAHRLAAPVAVVDGYHFSADYQRWLKEAGLRLLFIDDNGHAAHYYADFVLNQNVHADVSLYPSIEPYTTLLLGTRYALLRREFWKWRGWQRNISDVASNILVTLGGSDPDNVTLKVLCAIAQIADNDSLHVRVVVGGSNPHLPELQAFAAETSLSVEFLYNATNMPEVMAWADMAISAGGSTMWELCMMGVPSIMVCVADNQKYATELLSKTAEIPRFYADDPHITALLPLNLEALRYNTNARQNISSRLIQIVDGYGVDRLIRSVYR
jgi:UDP-2,4-diacetamido-2,4,6-trideoxy-beta-L-altropyranose hydrolase